MIKTSLLLTKFTECEPLNDPSVFSTAIPPLERVKSFAPEAFESFIGEWVISCVKSMYKDVYKVGGSGDGGIDVLSEYENGEYDYYQCKRYDKKLSPSSYWTEFGKLCYNIFIGNIPMPKKYYIIASQGIGPKMLKLIKDPEQIRKELIKNWHDKCEKEIIANTAIELGADLEKYINSFDFSIVDYYSIEKVIEEHRHTHYFYFRFGGNIKPKRTISLSPPIDIKKSETKYISKILDAYSDNKKTNIELEDLKIFDDLSKDFNKHRTYFYSAESLKRCIRDIFTNDDEFINLKKEVLSGSSCCVYRISD